MKTWFGSLGLLEVFFWEIDSDLIKYSLKTFIRQQNQA